MPLFHRACVLALAGAVLTTPLLAAAPDPGTKPVSFVRDIRPILARNCFACHGPDESQRKAKLRLDTKEGLFAGIDGRHPFVPGSTEESEAFARVTSDDPEERMPPGKDVPRLTAEQVDLLKRWIAQGATWESHWAFEAPKAAPLPAVKDSSWPRNPIDHFVLARLEAQGLHPSPEADRYTLIRRLSLDLTGLPPISQAAADFLEDRSEDAYEKLVDQLLRSPAYGERWARPWLDLARFADTKGYEKDLRRTNYRYRDWVIAAFNDDMPYDRFTVAQLAGDLLPGATDDQRLATAFHRNTLSNDEGGTDDEEFRIAAVKDRIDTTMQVWMGLTFGCAKCHTHKYDPISHKDYYRFYAVFNQTEDSDKPDDRPAIPFPTRDQSAQIDRLKAEIARLDVEKKALTSRWLEDGNPSTGKDVPKDVAEILKVPAALRTEAQTQRLTRYHADEAPETKPIRDQVGKLQGEINAILASVRTPILRELPEKQRRTTKLHRRGNFLDPGETVDPATPEAFPPLPKEAKADRLGVARWLMDPANPLTARVAVNRHWAQFFGRGLVESQEDFGAQGQPPSHPELLDWLALDFRDNGWSFKQLCKRIVMSATYRQSSRATPELLKADRTNRWLARGPRFRLEAEMIRDSALSVSGLLSSKMYGPSVMPSQPEGIWRSTYNTTKWEISPGADRYRRGLYTFVKRTSPYPAMIAFDAPSREVCTIRRVNTNTPLQALVTLNDAVYIEAAQALARRAVKQAGQSTFERIEFALRAALSRPAETREVAVLADLYERRLAFYRNDPADARSLATEPLGPLPEGLDPAEMAALASVCNVILNLDEFLTRG